MSWLILAGSYRVARDAAHEHNLRPWRWLASRAGLDFRRWHGDILILPGWSTGWSPTGRNDMESLLRTAEALGSRLHWGEPGGQSPRETGKGKR